MNPLFTMLNGAAKLIHSPAFGGRTFTGANGAEFVGVLEDQQSLDGGFPLGDDVREKALLHILPGVNAVMPTIASQDLLSEKGTADAWRVVKRVMSSAAVDVVYEVIKEANGD